MGWREVLMSVARNPEAGWKPKGRLGTWSMGAAALAMAAGMGSGALASDPMVNVSRNQLKFVSQVQGTASAAQVIVLTSIGPGELTISSITIAGENSADFTESHGCPLAPRVLGANATCDIHVQFQPRVTGELSASLSISDNASGSPQSVSLTGTSTSPAAVLTLAPPSLAFDGQTAGTTSIVRVVVLTNAGSATMNITSAIRLNGPSKDEFRLQQIENACPSDTGQLAAKASCAIGVVFTPATVGAKSAEVIIEDDAPGSPQAFGVSGTSTATRNTP